MDHASEFTVAAIQAAPVYFDREASTEKACRLIAEAGNKGATLTAFSETWLPGYPFFQLSDIINNARADYLANAVRIPSPTTDRLCQAANAAGTDVVIGIAELDNRTLGTVYCTLLFISREGVILGRHRKLKPTDAERRVWGEGDGVGLTVYDRPYGRISGLNCWEHNMVLPGYALMAQGTQIHVAAWPSPKALDPSASYQGIFPGSGILLSRAFAHQGSCYAIATGATLQPEDVSAAYRDIIGDQSKTPKGNEGGCCIIAPGGEVIARTKTNEETVLTASVSLEAVYRAKGIADVGGHYSRPDVLKLHINKSPLERMLDTSDSDHQLAADNGDLVSGKLNLEVESD